MPSTRTDRLSGITTSVAVKAPVKAVAIANITLSGEQTVNGVACVSGDRVLVTAQSSSVNNGIYVVSTGPWARAADFDGALDVVKGTLVVSNTGTTIYYRLTTADPITIGTSSLVFEAVSGSVSQSSIAEALFPDSEFLLGADPTGSADSTTALQAAIDTGLDVLIPSGTYLANNLTQSTNFQRLIALGEVKIQKNASGALLTSSGDDVELNGIGFRGDASSPTYTGDGVVMTGARPRLNNCGSRWMSGRAVKITGSGSLIMGSCDIYQTTDATGSGYDIELGVSGTATLYHRIVGIRTGQATGGIYCIDTGSVSIGQSQFGKLTVASGTSPSGVNGGGIIGCRILGDVTVGLSNSAFSANTLSTVTITFSSGTSGHSFDESNVLASGATLTDDSNNSTVIDSRQVPLTTYTPTWTAASVNPAIGNGTLTGKYTKRGRNVTVFITLTAGSTTTFGTGVYRFALPFVPSTSTRGWGSGLIVDSGTANYVITCRTAVDGTANLEVFAPNQASPTVPMTWASGDSLDLTVTYTT